MTQVHNKADCAIRFRDSSQRGYMVYREGWGCKWACCMAPCYLLANGICDSLFMYKCGFIITGERVSQWSLVSDVKPNFKTRNDAVHQTLVWVIFQKVFQTRDIYKWIIYTSGERELRAQGGSWWRRKDGRNGDPCAGWWLCSYCICAEIHRASLGCSSLCSNGHMCQLCFHPP